MVLSFIASIPIWGYLLAFVLLVVVVIYILLPKGESVLWYPNEYTYVDPNKGNKKEPFSGLDYNPEVEVSLIAPAYNESERLPIMVADTMKYLQTKKKENPSFSYELVIVDDGSSDKTTEIALKYVKQYGVDSVRVLTLHKNRGKGGAVKRGMLVGRGRYLLMLDADGATQISDLDRLLNKMKKVEKNGHGVVVGSRAHLQSDAVAKRTLLRNILMWGFHILVKLAGVPDIKDTQCGFKLFTRKSAGVLFSNMHVERWAFDVELLYLAHNQKIPVQEEAVNWREIPGSKLSPFGSSVQMAFDLTRIRLAYLVGVWKIRKQNKRE